MKVDCGEKKAFKASFFSEDILSLTAAGPEARTRNVNLKVLKFFAQMPKNEPPVMISLLTNLSKMIQVSFLTTELLTMRETWPGLVRDLRLGF